MTALPTRNGDKDSRAKYGVDFSSMWGVYLHWRKEHWFKEMERGYNYDRYFQPGVKVETHYRAKAGVWGLRPGYFSDLTKEEQESIRVSEGRSPS